jgi:pyridoxamine 5'-phosphate oxidase
VVQFHRWYDDASAARVAMPEAMALATASPDGRPSVRMVLLKSADERGFVFFTNYGSRKGIELNSNPRGALVFHWLFPGRPNRQVRVEGSVRPVSDEESDIYFQTRPRPSQLAAWASEQSRPLGDRRSLEDTYAEVAARYGDGHVPRPPTWGGYRLVHDEVEFWLHRDDRLHDRLRYRRGAGGSWIVERLAP